MKKLNLGKILTCTAIVFALVAFFMMFAPAAVQESIFGKSTLSGTDMAFGYTEEKMKILGASANIVTYVLVLVGVICAVVALLGKGGNIVRFIAVACFVVAAVFFFCTIQFANFYPDADGKAKDELVKTIKDSLDLGAGAIVGGVFSIVAAAATAIPVFLKK